jgi:hypothetical protein
MARIPPSLPADIFGRCLGTGREARVRQLLLDADELVRDERPGFRRLGNAIRLYLLGDAASLEHALNIATPKGSTLTPKKLARQTPSPRRTRAR